MKNIGKITLILVIGLLGACGYWEGLNSTSEIVNYRGTLKVENDSSVSTSICIYAANLDYKVKDSGDRPIHPENNGNYLLTVTTKSHPVSNPIEHWECGPLRILIEGDNIVTYYDSLTNDELKVLEQNSAGEWVLPDITVQRK